MSLITKANRRVKQPAWQRGLKVPDKEQRDALAITANHEQKFSRAFLKLLRDLLTPDMLRQIGKLVRSDLRPNEIIDQIPFFDPDNPKTFAIWQGFAHKMEGVYTKVIEESVQNENRKRGWKVDVFKVEAPELPANATPADFVRIRSLTRVVDISDKERERIREILIRGLERRVVPSSMIEEIEDTVGLTVLQAARVERRVAAAAAVGAKGDQLRKIRQDLAAGLRRQRARTIARTEANDAISRGLTESWKRAADAGLSPPGTKKRWVAMAGDDRISEICEDLDGQEVGLNENFSSGAGEGFTGEGPPAHPNCRSTMVLVFPS